MGDVPQEHVSPYPKRKRAPTLNMYGKNLTNEAVVAEKTSAPINGKYRTSVGTGVKGVVIGHWRHSTAPTDEEKHVVIGFIDVRGSLRTRIQPNNSLGQNVGSEYPMPSGPGGSWVTFPNIFFLSHLVGLESVQVKEYVKLRSDAYENTPEETLAAEKEAAKKAVALVAANPYEPNYNPNIAYGADLPEHLALRADPKRRKTNGTFPTSTQLTPQQTPRPVSQPSTSTTRILIGHYRSSSESNPRDKHAVYGILSQANNFRVKVVRETRDGHEIHSDFPIGPEMWIPWDEVVLDNHLENLSRPEIKEYCRIRQVQIDGGETPEQRIMNETKAVYDAQTQAAWSVGYKASAADAPANDSMQFNELEQPNGVAGPGGQELRTSTRRIEREAFAAAQALAQAQTQAEQERVGMANKSGRSRRSINGKQLRERTEELANQMIARAENTMNRANLQAESRQRAEAAAAQETSAAAATLAAPRTNSASGFRASSHVQRLNSVWAGQETQRLRGGDVKIYDGRKYERKTHGPLVGKLVSQGNLINIDGEDFVEYRVLMKPA